MEGNIEGIKYASRLNCKSCFVFSKLDLEARLTHLIRHFLRPVVIPSYFA